MERYSKIKSNNSREIVLLKGNPCIWGKCAFCDYIHDNDIDQETCHKVNIETLKNVTGEFKALEVINSGSVFELPEQTINLVKEIVRKKGIETIYFESYWGYRDRLKHLRKMFDINVIFKCGIETFNENFRNKVLKKGIIFKDPKQVSKYFNSICLLVGIYGQTKEMIDKDIDILLKNFEFGCINIFNNNSTNIKRDEKLVKWFCEKYSYLQDYDNIDFLIENTDFGVG